MTTMRQTAANQANAQKSTGPKTAEGRAKSSLNAVRHGLSGASHVQINDPLGAEELNESIRLWVDETDAVTEFECRLAEIMAVESARCRDCQIRESELREREARRAETAWELDRRAEAEEAAKKLAKEPSATLAVLRRSAQGVRWLRIRWEGLLRALDAPEGWNETEKNLALDLIGTPLELRRGRTAVDPFPRAEVLEAIRREASPAHSGNSQSDNIDDERPIDPTDSQALIRLPALREEDPTLYRCGFVEAMIEHLDHDLERLDVVEELDRRAASRKMSPDISRELKLIRRYETASFRRFQWARACYRELVEGLAEYQESVFGEPNESPVDLSETFDNLRRLQGEAKAKDAKRAEAEEEQVLEAEAHTQVQAQAQTAKAANPVETVSSSSKASDKSAAKTDSARTGPSPLETNPRPIKAETNPRPIKAETNPRPIKAEVRAGVSGDSTASVSLARSAIEGIREVWLGLAAAERRGDRSPSPKVTG